MIAERWQRVRELFERALETSAENRAALLDQLCGGDTELRAEVESLLHSHALLDDQFLEPRGGKMSLDPAPEPWAELLIGRKIGRYTVQRLVGHGGMGCVFEARQDRPDRAVALKVLRPGFTAPSALARFRLEPEVLGRLRHPNIAQVYEAGVHEGEHGAMPYFAMELIPEAQPLLEYAEARTLAVGQRLELFAKICDAVHHGHQKGIIHRDLKPGNLLVGADGEPKVIDFGVARASDADIMLTTQCTHVGDLVGTVHYMSPEQCDGDPAAIDTRSDIYSLGVVLYELLTGSAPYDTSGTTVYGAMRIIKEEPPRRPSSAVGKDGQRARDARLARRLRGDLDAILLKTLEKEPAWRYASAADLAQDIRRRIRGESIEARQPGPWRRAVLWVGRRPRTAAALSGVTLFALIALVTLVSTHLYVRHYFEEPIKISTDTDVPSRVQLLNRRGLPMHTWNAGPNGTIVASLIAPFPDEPQRKQALLRFGTASLPDRACALRAYDVRGDLDRPLWTSRLEPHELPATWLVENVSADQFSPSDVWMFDIFPEPGPQRADEIVCRFGNNTRSQRALCVYRAADGALLYRVWHDGSFSCHWLSGPGLLIVAGENWEKFPHQRGCPDESPTSRMLVVFALRPAVGVGVHEPELIDSADLHSCESLVWYKWLAVCPIPDVDWSWDVAAPSDGDAATVAQLGLNIATEPPSRIIWRVDPEGNPITGTLVGPTYTMSRPSNPSLPSLEAFQLQDRPPGE